MMNSYRVGLFTELCARIYLRLHGFHILKKRYVTGRFTDRAEIDIIAKRHNLILFVEVKKRNNIESALDAITHAQIKRLHNAAETYLNQIRWTGNARFDVIVFTPYKMKWIQGAI